jgi:hypothetical protein
MTACPSRYLTADGQTLMCMVDVHRPEFPQHFDKDFSEGSAWMTEDPCAWEAPDCQECRGSGCSGWVFPEDFHRCGNCCPDCKGTGVDETIPMRLVGVGSVLAHPDYAEFRCVVIARDASGCPKVAAVDTDGGLRSSFVAWDDGWTVARAVPPAHTEETR